MTAHESTKFGPKSQLYISPSPEVSTLTGLCLDTIKYTTLVNRGDTIKYTTLVNRGDTIKYTNTVVLEHSIIR
jgi:hypothetical protein